MARLAADDRDQGARDLAAPHLVQHGHRVRDGAEGIAELVAEHREKSILGPVGRTQRLGERLGLLPSLSQLLFRALPVGDVNQGGPDAVLPLDHHDVGRENGHPLQSVFHPKPLLDDVDGPAGAQR